MHQLGPFQIVHALRDLRVQQPVHVDVEDKCILTRNALRPDASVRCKSDPGASIFGRPVTAGCWEFVPEIVAPQDAPAESYQSHEGQRPDEDNEANVGNPEDFVPLVVLLLFVLDLLGADDVGGGRNRLGGALDQSALDVVVGLAALPRFLVPNAEVEVEAARDEANDGQAHTHQVRVVDRGQDELEEAQRETYDRDRDVFVARKALRHVAAVVDA